MKPVILQLLGGVFELIWIGAVIASIYFLYGALANDAPVYYLPGMIGVAFIAKSLAVILKSRKEQMDYVDRLVERGYTHADATSAWEIAINGGSNLLLNLQQTDTSVDTVENAD